MGKIGLCYIAVFPPSTKIVEPVIYDAASEERNNATEATSSALPILFKGVVFEYCLIKFESCFNCKPATCPLIAPGQIELTRMLNFP